MTFTVACLAKFKYGPGEYDPSKGREWVELKEEILLGFCLTKYPLSIFYVILNLVIFNKVDVKYQQPIRFYECPWFWAITKYSSCWFTEYHMCKLSVTVKRKVPDKCYWRCQVSTPFTSTMLHTQRPIIHFYMSSGVFSTFFREGSNACQY